MLEMLDIYDDNLVHIGVKERVQAHRDGNWHQVFHCWVVSRQQKNVIFQKRASTKTTFPNYLDTSAAGHLEAGETIADSIRELHEELGLTGATMHDLIPLGFRYSVAQYDNLIDREFAHIFLFPSDLLLQDYVYQKEEITGLIAIGIEDGLRLFSGELDTIVVPAHGFDKDHMTITRQDFIPSYDQYYYRVFVVAERWIQNEKYLVI